MLIAVLTALLFAVAPNAPTPAATTATTAPTTASAADTAPGTDSVEPLCI